MPWVIVRYSCNPDILMLSGLSGAARRPLDEIPAVGDAVFQQQCFDKLADESILTLRRRHR
jgi:ABC-type polysaccharide/polyol phosphate transport system ATPase subunit